MAYNGTLEVLVVEGKGLKNKELFTKQDPYVKLMLDNQALKTRTHHNGGKNPTWNQTVHLNLLPGTTVLRLEVWDEDSVKDDLIGAGIVNLDPVLRTGSQDLWVDLRTRSGSNAGQLRLVIYFRSKSVGTPQQFGGISSAVPNAYVPPATGYPSAPYSQQGYPPAGYPPPPVAAQGYPAPQQPMGQYPPPQQPYPAQGYPPAGYPPPQQPYGAPSYPQQGYPPPGQYPPPMPGQGYPPSMPGQGYPPPQQPYPGQGYPPTGYPPNQYR